MSTTSTPDKPQLAQYLSQPRNPAISTFPYTKPLATEAFRATERRASTASALEIGLASASESQTILRESEHTTPCGSAASSPRSRVRRPVKKRGRSARVWRPLDLQDQIDIDVSITSDPSQWSGPTSLDVHAKTFRPSSRLSGGVAKPVDRRSLRIATPVTPGVEQDFTMGKPIHFSGLNAYEIKADTVNATVAASFNRRELVAVFGSDLPSPGVCQNHPGLLNGLVQFCVHPNGDVSAHQWSSNSYHWLNIGQFSNIRKRTEGQLASDRLKGETETQSLQQNTLAYFRAVAKQREAISLRIPFSVKNLYPIVTENDTPSENDVTPDGLGNESSMLGDDSAEITPAGTPTAISYARRRPNAGLSARISALSGRQQFTLNEHSTDRPTDVGSTQHVSADRSIIFGSHQDTLHENYNDTHQGHRVDSTQPSESFEAGVDGKVRPKQELNAFIRGIMAREVSYDSRVGQDTVGNMAPIPISTTDRFSERRRREGLSAEVPIQSSGNVQRTVLHDPLRTRATKITVDSDARAMGNGFADGSNLPGSSNDSSQLPPMLHLPEYASRNEVTRNEEVISPPSYFDGQVLMNQIKASREQLSLFADLAPQNWSGPFFSDSGEEGYGRQEELPPSYEEKLNTWFTGGNTVERQDEFFQSIMIANTRTGSSATCHNPGIIGSGPRRTASMPSANSNVDPGFNTIVSRLLIPVLENLSSYVQKPSGRRNCRMTRFCAPPEWCIDRSPSGNRSFFEQDWGKVPDRIGRDERYRHMAYDGRYDYKYGGASRAPRRGAAHVVVPRMPSGTRF